MEAKEERLKERQKKKTMQNVDSGKKDSIPTKKG